MEYNEIDPTEGCRPAAGSGAVKTKGARFDVPESGGLMRERFAFLDRTWFRLALSLGVLFAAFGFFLYILAAEARVNALEERRQDVRRLVEVARASLRPILSRVRDGELSREDGRRQTYAIVGEDEADPAAGSISYISPLARALMGKTVGDTAVVNGAEVEIIELA